MDEERSSVNSEARILSCSLARFTRSDPLAESMREESCLDPQRMNLYAYCRNRPLVHEDPTGMEDVPKDSLAASQSTPTPDSGPSLSSADVESARSRTFLEKNGLAYEEGGRCSGYTIDYAKRLNVPGVDGAVDTQDLRVALSSDSRFKQIDTAAACTKPGSVVTWKRDGNWHGEVVSGIGPVSKSDPRISIYTQGCRNPGDSQFIPKGKVSEFPQGRESNRGCGNAQFRIDWLSSKVQHFKCFEPKSLP